ncbi:MAG: PEGA domain-containing protein [Myxococcota bacterium]
MTAIFWALFVMFQPAWAGNTADEAEVNFQIARKSYAAGDFEKALFHFMVSNRLSENRNVMFNIGLTYEQLRRYPEAYRWYQDAYDDALPDDETNKRIEKTLVQLRRNVAIVKVDSDPPGATVYLQRKNLGAVGTTPLEIPVRPGRYTFIFEREGYEEVSTDPTMLQAGMKAEAIEVDLVPIVGQVDVAGVDGANIRIGREDAEPQCQVPCMLDLPEGRQFLFFDKPGYRTLPKVVDVVEGQEVPVTADLAAITGALVVDADLRAALVEIDGQPAGYTPLVIPDVTIGKHEVRLSARGYAPYQTVVDIQEGESTDLGRVSLDPIFTVTAASRYAQDVAEAPASVNLIPKEELQAFGYQTVIEALQGLRGVYSTDDLAYESLGIRGFNRLGDYGNRVLVTLDGHRTNDNFIGSSQAGNDFLGDLEDVTRIEFVRGPGSALYGSNAVFGVINVVTKGRGDEITNHAVLSAANNGVRARVSVGASKDDRGFYISANGLYNHRRMFFFDEYAEDRFSGGFSDQDDTYARHLMGKAWSGDFVVQGYLSERERFVPNGFFGTRLGDPRTIALDRRAFLEGRYVGEINNTRLNLRVFYDHFGNRTNFPYEPRYIFQDDHYENGLGALAQVNQRFGDIFDVTIGAETRQFFLAELRSFEREALDEEPFAQAVDIPIPTQIYSGYALADFHPGKIFRLNVGGRVDSYRIVDRDFSTINPRASLILSPGNEVIKVIGGTAFRAPSPFEFFFNDSGISSLPAIDLVPETIQTAEFEWTHRFDQVLTSTVNAYYNRIDDLVETEDVPLGELKDKLGTKADPDAGVFRYTSSQQPIVTLGAEAEIRRWWRSGWMVAAQLSYQRTRLNTLFEGDDTPPSERPQPITNSPEWMASIIGSIPLSSQLQMSHKVRAETNRLTNAGDTTQGAVIWDVTLIGRVAKPNVRYGLGVRNLLDFPVVHPGGDDLIIDQLPQRGRTVFASVRVDL